MISALLALALVPGCTPRDLCVTDEEVLASQGDRELRCDEARVVDRYGEALAARPISAHHERRLLEAVARAWRADPEAVDAVLARVESAVEELVAVRGLEAAELRSTRIWEHTHGEGPLEPVPAAAESVSRAVAVWTSDDEERLSMSEIDIEGWVYYGSLCREVQGAGTLRLSVSDRVHVYAALQERFQAADRQGQVAQVALGAFWQDVQGRWAAASYEQQQGWIAAAPLPPPMTASSLGYATSLLEGDLSLHARILHEHFGPLALRAQ